jgi:hypothetical protein
MNHKLSVAGLAFGVAAAAGISILSVGLLALFTGIGQSFIESIDSLYPGSGTGPRGILTLIMFGVFHGLLSGAMIAFFYNAYSGSNGSK